jgi:hypothetical protein
MARQSEDQDLFLASLEKHLGPRASAIARDLADLARILGASVDYRKGRTPSMRCVVRTEGAAGKDIGFPKPFIIRPDGTVEIDLKKLASQRPAFPRVEYLRLLDSLDILDAATPDLALIRFPIARLEEESKLTSFKGAMEWFIQKLRETERIRE